MAFANDSKASWVCWLGSRSAPSVTWVLTPTQAIAGFFPALVGEPVGVAVGVLAAVLAGVLGRSSELNSVTVEAAAAAEGLGGKSVLGTPILMKLTASWRVVWCLSAKALHILCSFLLLAWRLSQTRMNALRCRKESGEPDAPCAAADLAARRAWR